MSTELKPGDRIKDNDPRMPGRVLTITDILPNGVVARDARGREFGYLRRRIHTDGKPRKSGFSLIKGNSK
ncbi:hypothetical protein [Caldimonas sp. KR1-144]|uniref:hypothetical protein n=1 Tax=Caldimonas sp. KR1-144 TaxID=3400911 RepID=UPI003C040813